MVNDIKIVVKAPNIKPMIFENQTIKIKANYFRGNNPKMVMP